MHRSKFVEHFMAKRFQPYVVVPISWFLNNDQSGIGKTSVDGPLWATRSAQRRNLVRCCPSHADQGFGFVCVMGQREWASTAGQYHRQQEQRSQKRFAGHCVGGAAGNAGISSLQLNMTFFIEPK